jgi:hypothetical protein
MVISEAVSLQLSEYWSEEALPVFKPLSEPGGGIISFSVEGN